MEAQKPAMGILQKADYNHAKWYEVECECGSKDHYHSIWIEADYLTKDITVSIYTEATTDYWTNNSDRFYWFREFVRRAKLIWNIATRGYIKYESHVILKKQQALNYAGTLHRVINELDQE